MKIRQKKITLKPRPRGYHLVTEEIESSMPELKEVTSGIANIFMMHTSASLTINENADPTVRSDFNTFFDKLVPEDMSLYEHTAEGPDDMTSHIKSSMLDSSLTIPVSKGRFAFGTWQGIFLCEHRDRARPRNLMITIIGE